MEDANYLMKLSSIQKEEGTPDPVLEAAKHQLWRRMQACTYPDP